MSFTCTVLTCVHIDKQVNTRIWWAGLGTFNALVNIVLHAVVGYDIIYTILS